MKALLGALKFVHQNFENETHRNYIMKVIIDASLSADSEVRLCAMQCLVRAAEFYYKFLGTFFESIWKVSWIRTSYGIEELNTKP